MTPTRAQIEAVLRTYFEDADFPYDTDGHSRLLLATTDLLALMEQAQRREKPNV